MSIKILVFDVDGTLYDLNTHCIPESCVNAIKEAKDNGYLFVIATGRAHYGLGHALNELHPDYILSANGGVVVNSEHQVIAHQDIPYNDCLALLEFAREQQAGLIFKFLNHMYIYQYPEKVDWLQGQMESDIGTEPFIYHPEQIQHTITLPQCASIHANANLIRVFAKQSSLSFHQFSDCGFDVAPKSVHKGAGLQTLMNYLHISKENVICFGDNYNDLEMMDVAGISVAMGNAVDAIKEKANYITTSSDQDGIAKGLRHFHCIK